MRISDWSSDVCSSDLSLRDREELLRDLDDHFVRANDAQLAPHHLVGEVGIGAARVEQVRPVRQPGPLFLELGEDQALLLLQAPIVAPGEDAVGADHGIAEEVGDRSEEHTSELQSLMRISYAVFC